MIKVYSFLVDVVCGLLQTNPNPNPSGDSLAYISPSVSSEDAATPSDHLLNIHNFTIMFTDNGNW